MTTERIELPSIEHESIVLPLHHVLLKYPITNNNLKILELVPEPEPCYDFIFLTNQNLFLNTNSQNKAYFLKTLKIDGLNYQKVLKS